MFSVIPRFPWATLARRHSSIEIDQAANVAGWMSYKELEWLAKQAQKHHTIVEIGSYQGRSTRALGDNTSGIVYAVDDFKGPRDRAVGGIPVAEIFMGNMLDLIQIGRVQMIVSDHSSLELNVRPDMVFIDGSHEYADVKRDIAYWKDKMLPGSLICGHDAQFQQVNQAVSESFDKFKVAPKTSIWYVDCA